MIDLAVYRYFLPRKRHLTKQQSKISFKLLLLNFLINKEVLSIKVVCNDITYNVCNY